MDTEERVIKVLVGMVEDESLEAGIRLGAAKEVLSYYGRSRVRGGAGGAGGADIEEIWVRARNQMVERARVGGGGGVAGAGEE